MTRLHHLIGRFLAVPVICIVIVVVWVCFKVLETGGGGLWRGKESLREVVE